MACGELGLTIEYFYWLTPRQFVNIVTGYAKKRESDLKISWEQTRFMMYAALAPHQKKGSSISPQRIMPFPWEKEDTVLTDLKKLESEVLEKNTAFWARIDNIKA